VKHAASRVRMSVNGFHGDVSQKAETLQNHRSDNLKSYITPVVDRGREISSICLAHLGNFPPYGGYRVNMLNTVFL
jgi:hypothetical protein